MICFGLGLVTHNFALKNDATIAFKLSQGKFEKRHLDILC